MTVKLVHAGIVVSSMENSIDFYENLLCFKRQRSFELPAEIIRTLFEIDSPASVQVLACDSGALELFLLKDTNPAAQNPVKRGLNHFALETENLDSFVDSIKLKGGKLKSSIKDGRAIWFVVDPDGTLIELKQAKK